MADSEQFDYNGAKAVLEGKGLLAEIEEVVKGLSFVEELIQVPKESTEMSVDELMKLPEQMVPALQKFFVQRGWNREVVLLKETAYRHDAFKNGVLVEIDLSCFKVGDFVGLLANRTLYREPMRSLEAARL